MKLTIGMPCYRDYDGVYMTVNALRQYHDLTDCEILIGDNDPESEQGRDTRAFVEQVADPNVRYFRFSEAVGPANAKDAIFEHAKGDAVLVMDAHILLEKDAIAKTKKHYDDNPTTLDFYQGPRYMDNLLRRGAATHFNPIWSGGMLGQWATAWMAPNADIVQAEDHDGKLVLRNIRNRDDTIETELSFYGHEEWMIANGYTLAIDRDDLIEIPSQGMGLFTCRREAWLGFNKSFREFGGEEGYIHDKYHNAGRKTWCIPWLGWQHKDRKSERAEYPRRTEMMFRNYVLGHKENGRDMTELIEHYSTRIPADAMKRVLDDPEAYQPAKIVAPSEPVSITAKHRNRNELFNWCLQQKFHKLNEHGVYLSKFASKFKHVTEISCDHESSIYLMSGSPNLLRSYQEESDYKIDLQKKLLGKEENNRRQIVWTLTPGSIEDMPAIEDTEALFLNSRHTYDRLKQELETYSIRVSKMIVIAKSIQFGERGEDGGPGMGKAVYEFIKANPQWYILRQDMQQSGMTTLSCVPNMRPIDAMWPWDKGCGPGTELKKMFADLGIVSSLTCNCNARAREMDQMGIEWCEEHIDKIVGWLKEEHAKQAKVNAAIKANPNQTVIKSNGKPVKPTIVQRVVNALPFSETIAKMSVNKAISRAKLVRDAGGCDE